MCIETSRKSQRLSLLLPGENTIGNLEHLQEKMAIAEWLKLCKKVDVSHVPPALTPTILQPSDEGREILEGFNVYKVTKANLDATQELLREIFPDETAHFDVTFAALDKPLLCNDEHKVIARMEQWLIVEKVSGKAAATVGFYYKEEDVEDALWGSWYGVSPQYQRRGLGLAMILFGSRRALSCNKKYFRLYTEDMEEEVAANRIYELLGIKVYEEEALKSGTKRLWRQVQIGGSPFRHLLMVTFVEMSILMFWLRGCTLKSKNSYFRGLANIPLLLISYLSRIVSGKDNHA